MSDAPELTVRLATEADEPTIVRLWERQMHDLHRLTQADTLSCETGRTCLGRLIQLGIAAALDRARPAVKDSYSPLAELGRGSAQGLL